MRIAKMIFIPAGRRAFAPFVSMLLSALCACSLPTIDLDGVARKKDSVAPILAVTSPREGELCANIVEIRGKVSDAAVGGAAGSIASLAYSVLGTAIKGSAHPDAEGGFSFVLDATTAGTNYTVELVAEDWNGNKRSLSLGLARGASAGIPSLAANGANRSIVLSWDGIPKARGYTLYYTKDGTLPSAANHEGNPLAVSAGATSYTLDHCENGALYTFLLASEPEPGLNSCLSDYVRAIPLSPRTLAPQAAGLKGKIRVSWPEIPGGSDFSLWRSETNLPGTFVKVAEVAGNAYTDASTRPGQAYFYSVRPSRYGAVPSVNAFAEEAIEAGAFSSAMVVEPGLLEPWCRGLAADRRGEYLYASGPGGKIAVFDIRDRTRAALVKSIPVTLPGGVATTSVKSLFAYGDALYCVAGGSDNQERLLKYAIADPSSPTAAAGFFPQAINAGGSKPNLAMAGGFLCVTRGSAGVSIHDAATGVLKSTFLQSNGSSMGDLALLSLQAAEFLVAARGNGVEFLQMNADGTATRKVAYSCVGAEAYEYAVASGTTVFAGKFGGSNITIFDCRYVASGSSVSKFGELAIDGGLAGDSLRVVGTKLVAGSLKGMLYYYDIGDPAKPFLVGATPQAYYSQGLAVADPGTVYSCSNAGIMVNRDANQYARPLASTSIPAHPARMAILGDRAYIVGAKAGGSGSLVHVTLASATPAVGELDLGCTEPSDLAISGPRAYVTSVAASAGLAAVVDLADPANPRRMPGKGEGGRHQGIGLFGETAITTASIDAFTGFDISDLDAPPGNPYKRVTGLLGHAYSRIWVEGSYAYTLLGQSVRSLQIVDLRDTSLRSTASVNGEFCVYGGNLHARQAQGGRPGLAVFGLDNPEDPQFRGFAYCDELLLPNGDDPQGILGMAASGDFVFVANGAKGLARFNVANPAAPYFAGSLLPAGMTSVWEVAVSGSTLVVAGETAGGHAVATYSLKP